MQMKNLNFASISGILIGLLGIFGPIIWDYYKTNTAIELRVVGKSTIVSKPEKMDGLVISYSGEVLNELSKTSFVIVNSGRTPIHERDVAAPISIKFSDESDIIDAKIDSVFPQDLDASLYFNKTEGSIALKFPLLNPGDKIDFSILSKTSNITFDAAGRIAGVPSLIVKDISQERGGIGRRWVVYFVGIFSALLFLVAIVALFTLLPDERRIKSQVRAGTFLLPSLKSKTEWFTWINSTFKFTTEKEREPLLQLMNGLPDTESLAISHREQIMVAIQSVLRHSMSNLTAVGIVFGIALIGCWYVITNW